MIAKKAGLLVGVIGAAATLAAAAEGGEGGEGRHGRQFVVPYYAVGPVRVAPPPVVYVPPPPVVYAAPPPIVYQPIYDPPVSPSLNINIPLR